MIDQIIVTALTVLVVVANLATSIRAFYVAIFLDTTCTWICVRGSKRLGLEILLGFGVVCMILAILKSWSIIDIFIDHWVNMPREYHIRSFAYLAENFGVAILGWKVTTLIKTIGGCNGRAADMIKGRIL